MKHPDLTPATGAPAIAAKTMCASCGRTEATPLYVVDGFSVVQCPCGLARTVLPPGFDTASIYTSDYYEGGHKDGYPHYEQSADELRHEFRRVIAALRRHVTGGKLIEYGCAYGYLLEEASASFQTLGIELSDHARQHCEARGLSVEREATPELLTKHGPFDAAVMLDVLEHMTDPAEALRRVHAAMRPGAQLLVTTGDFGSLLARVMRARWRLMTPPQHLWFFSRATLEALLTATGFRLHTFGHPWKHVPLALIAYQATRYLGGQAFVQRLVPRGRLPVNLFDAMRVIATRV